MSRIMLLLLFQGDFVADSVKAMIEKYFGEIPAEKR